MRVRELSLYDGRLTPGKPEGAPKRWAARQGFLSEV